MLRRLAALAFVAIVMVSCTKEEPPVPETKKSSDLGTQGGATQVGMEPH